jgi:outer membrane biosynthesis protein TonB
MQHSLTTSILLLAAAIFSLTPIVAVAQQPEAPTGANGRPAAAPQRPAPVQKAADTCLDVAIIHPFARYPRSAFERHLGGWTEVTFALNGSGSASEIQIIDSEPGDLFVSVTTKALSQWTFQKNAVRARCHIIIEFHPQPSS